MSESKEIQAVQNDSLVNVINQVQQIQALLKNVMKVDEHYGKIPGCGEKLTLLKPGAEKLNVLFRFSPRYDVDRINHPNFHREYDIKCSLYSINTGELIAEGVGTCSTMESKYRFRWENTKNDVPSEYWNSRDVNLLGGISFAPRKIAGQWVIFQKIEHDNPADYYNTALKISKKRAFVDATITATAAGDIFTQDMEDVIENEAAASGKTKPKETKQAKYESKPPRQESGTGNDPKGKPSKEDADNFNTEMMAHFKNSDLVEQFLAGVNEYVTDVSKIKSYKQLGFFKGKFRALVKEEPANNAESERPLIPEADINDG